MADLEYPIRMKIKFSEVHSMSEKRENIQSNDSLPVIAHKIHKFFQDIENGEIGTTFTLEHTTLTVEATQSFEMNTIMNVQNVSTNLSGPTQKIICATPAMCNENAYIRAVNVGNGSSIAVYFDCNGSITSGNYVCSLDVVYLQFKK